MPGICDGKTSPIGAFARPMQARASPTALATSPRASANGLPISLVIDIAMSSARASNASTKLATSAPRSGCGFAAQPACARPARATQSSKASNGGSSKVATICSGAAGLRISMSMCCVLCCAGAVGADHCGGFFGNHKSGSICVGGCDFRHDRGINHAQPLHAIDPQFRVHNGVRV